MHKLHELKEKLMRELEDYADNGKFSKDDVEAIKYTASAIDHICNILEDVDEYSNAGDGGMNRSYTGDGNYQRSYARGRTGGRRGANQYGSYNMGYSRASENIANELREIMRDAPNDHIRQEINNLAQKVEQM